MLTGYKRVSIAEGSQVFDRRRDARLCQDHASDTNKCDYNMPCRANTLTLS